MEQEPSQCETQTVTRTDSNMSLTDSEPPSVPEDQPGVVPPISLCGHLASPLRGIKSFASATCPCSCILSGMQQSCCCKLESTSIPCLIPCCRSHTNLKQTDGELMVLQRQKYPNSAHLTSHSLRTRKKIASTRTKYQNLGPLMYAPLAVEVLEGAKGRRHGKPQNVNELAGNEDTCSTETAFVFRDHTSDSEASEEGHAQTVNDGVSPICTHHFRLHRHL